MDYIRADSKMNRRYMAAGNEVNTGKYETKHVLVHDVRPELNKYTLKTTGFQLVKYESQVNDWSNMDQLNTTYGDEIRDLMRNLTGADEVIVFGPVRRTTHDKDPNKVDSAWNDQPPASDVHVDYTPIHAECLAADFAKNNGLDIKDVKRYKMINLWRATSPGPQNWPLALCRGDSVGDHEGVINHLIYCDKVPDLDSLPEELPHDPMYPEGTLFTYSPNHCWTYFSNMTRDEVMLFTLYDSNKERPWRVPHCAFHNDMQGTKPRESVEIRTLCLFK
ncbi:hypothetical protein LTS15_003850 [Exophiala xenobiotica]|nr:hypothetical protein LTS15_003850 [Exophiala xenobiotica]